MLRLGLILGLAAALGACGGRAANGTVPSSDEQTSESTGGSAAGTAGGGDQTTGGASDSTGTGTSGATGTDSTGGGATTTAGAGATGAISTTSTGGDSGSGSDAGFSSPGTRMLVASIRVTASTNSAEVDVAVYDDGSADRTLGPARPYGTNSVGAQPQSYPPGSAEVVQFLADLRAVGDVSAIPIGSCAKSISFGTETYLTASGKMSGDMQCVADASSPDQRALAHDCGVLSGGAP